MHRSAKLSVWSRVAVVTAVLSIATPAWAANPLWPNRSATREELADPANWPDDPDYGPGAGGRGGQWDMWSFVPPEFTSVEGHRPQEIAMGAGCHADRAWQITIGDPRVLIAVLDSGIYWNHRDLVRKFHLNAGELPMPDGAAAHDADGSGVFDIDDYLGDPRVSDVNRNGTVDPGDLIDIFSDGVDGDANGYVDDISGWDFFRNDNNAFDETGFGHGTGEARDSCAETNNAYGMAGYCPLCRALMIRVGDSFVVDAQAFAQGVVFGVDSGASVIQEALGSVNNTAFMRQAIDYAWSRGATVVASAADENSYHHNYPGSVEHALYVHAIRPDKPEPQLATTFLNFNNCTNYGAQLLLSTPGWGCSSEATGNTSGIVGLLYSMALENGLSPALHPDEVKQILTMTVDDIWIPYEERMCDTTKYPSWEAWDQRFGYGRTNARRAVEWVRDGRIPPLVDITSPIWFEIFYPDRRPEIIIGGRISSRAPAMSYVVEWAPGIEPTPEQFTTIASVDRIATPVDGEIARLAVGPLNIDNPGEHWNRWTVTLRIRATAHYGGTIGDVPGEMRKAVYVHRDPDLLPEFPIWLGASGESSPKLADIDGDTRRDIVLATADGVVHAFRHDGTEAPGWPVRVRLLPGLNPSDRPNYRGSRAFASGVIDPDEVRSTIIATPAIGDLTGDGDLEIVAATEDGDVYVWSADGALEPGFPVGYDPSLWIQPDEDNQIDSGFFASPVLADLTGDGDLEILGASYDGYLYAWSHDGSPADGFPVLVSDPNVRDEPRERARIVTTPAVADFNGDGILDIVVGTNESYGGGYDARLYVVHGDGNRHAGGPFHPNWPIPVWSATLFSGSWISRGLPTSAALADVDADTVPDIATFGNASVILSVFRAAQPPRGPGVEARPARQLDTVSYGPLATSRDKPTAAVFAYPSAGDVDQDGRPDIVLGTAGFQAALNLASGGTAIAFDHHMSAWSSATGRMLPGFPQKVEDWQFFMNPTIAEISGDDYPEVLHGTGGYFVNAFDGCGRQPAGWPKFTGQWLIAAPAVGDIDGDGLREVVVPSRAGWLYVWRTRGRHDGAISWESFHHDNRNTGNFHVPLEHGRPTVASSPIDCSAETPPEFPLPLPAECYDAGDDADAGDAGDAGDAAGDADRPGDAAGGGCSCRTAGGGRAGAWIALLLVIALPATIRRARPRRR